MSTQEKTPRGRLKNKTGEEARRLTISKAHLLELFHQGIVPGVRISDRIILFDPQATDEALQKHHAQNLETNQN